MDIQSFRQFMGRTRNDLWHLTEPTKGFEHLGKFESILHSLLLIPVVNRSGLQEKHGILIMFSQIHWEVFNGHWNQLSYTGQFGIESVIVFNLPNETEQEALDRVKSLVFQYMHPKSFGHHDQSWKNEHWQTGGLYQRPANIAIGNFRNSRHDGLAS